MESSVTPSMVEVKYAGFWKRLGSQLIDVIIFSPLMVLAYFFYSSRAYYYGIAVPGLLIGIFFHVYLVQRYGGTPGKKLLKIEIRKLDLSKVTVKEAWLRYSVLLALSLVQQVGTLQGISTITDQELMTLSYTEFAMRLGLVTPKYSYYAAMVMGLWVWGEAIMIFFNKKKRAPHDYIAGTVVIESQTVRAPGVAQI